MLKVKSQHIKTKGAVPNSSVFLDACFGTDVVVRKSQQDSNTTCFSAVPCRGHR